MYKIGQVGYFDLYGGIDDKFDRKKSYHIYYWFNYIFTINKLCQICWHLFLLRLMMGVFTGFIPMPITLISTQTFKEIASNVLGTLQTGSIAGTLMGRLFRRDKSRLFLLCIYFQVDFIDDLLIYIDCYVHK